MTRNADPARRRAFKRDTARALRAAPSDAERKLWSLLRGKQVLNLRFRRQQPLGPYVADFYCSAAKLVIEVDGGQHASEEGRAYDEERTRFLNDRGIRVLRFWSDSVLRDPDVVLESIRRAVEETGIPLPETRTRVSTLPQGEGE